MSETTTPVTIALHVKKYMPSHDSIIAVYLFGSMATGKMRSSSDIDIAVMSTCKIDGFKKAEMETELSNLLRRDVDIVVFHQAEVLLQHQILKYGYLLYEKDNSERVRQETTSRREYLDTRFLFKEPLSRKLSNLSNYIKELKKADDINWQKYTVDPRSRAFVERYCEPSCFILSLARAHRLQRLTPGVERKRGYTGGIAADFSEYGIVSEYARSSL